MYLKYISLRLSYEASNSLVSLVYFYDLGGRIAVKLLPRFATPPIFVGYGIHFRPSSLDEAIHAIRQRYF